MKHHDFTISHDGDAIINGESVVCVQCQSDELEITFNYTIEIVGFDVSGRPQLKVIDD